jgi:predicted TIM-barrel fold metal-dependent hydrolase
MRARFEGGRLPDLVTMGGAIGGFSGVIAEFIYSGLLDRFPGLKLVGVEVGASWVPALLEHMDDHYWRNRTWTDTKLKLLPSEYFRRNWQVTFIREPFAIKVREAVGIKNMMWSTDYPHHRHDAPYSRRLIEDMFFGVPEEEKRAIVCMNAVELYDLPHVLESV